MRLLNLSLCLFSLMFGASTFAQSQTPPLSEHMCGAKFCTEKMLNIYMGFKDVTSSFEPISQAYTGTCYHIHPNLRPDKEHHGLVVIEKQIDGGLTFSGLFSFYTTTNPYSGKSLEEHQSFFNDRGARKHPSQLLSESEFFVDIGSSNGSNYYWIKSNGKKAYLMSMWVQTDARNDVRIFCDLTERAKSE